MSARSCARARSRRRAKSQPRAPSRRRSSRRSRTRKSRRSSPSRRRSASRSRPTANTAAPGGTSTFLECSTGVEIVRARPRHPIPGHPDEAAEHPRHRQDRVFQPPDAGSFPVSQDAHQGDAENDDPEPQRISLPPRTRRGRQECLCPTATPYFDDLAAAYAQGGARLLRRRLPLPAVRRHRHGRICARKTELKRRRGRPRARRGSTSRRPIRAPSTRRLRESRPT